MRRIRRPSSKRELLDRLIDSSQDGPFSSHVDAMIFSAALGASKDKHESFDSSEEPQVPEQYMRQSDREALFYLLGIYRTGDLELLQQDEADDLITAFEEYANGGLSVIQNEMERTGQNPREVILNLLDEAREERPDDEPDLSQITDELGF